MSAASLGEEGFAQGDAAHGSALHVQRLETLADDEFGAAPADVHDQTAFAIFGKGVGDALIDEARLFHTGDYFNGMTEGLFGRGKKILAVGGHAQRVGPHGAHRAAREMTQALAEQGEAVEGAFHRVRGEAFVGIEARGEAHHVAEAVDDDDLVIVRSRHHHVKAVGAEVDGGDGVREQTFLGHREHAL
jgi:hypothetical protein